jgi:hypothetical protein
MRTTFSAPTGSEALNLAEDCGRTTERPNILVVLAMIDAARGREQARELALAAIGEASAAGSAVIEAQKSSVNALRSMLAASTCEYSSWRAAGSM